MRVLVIVLVSVLGCGGGDDDGGGGGGPDGGGEPEIDGGGGGAWGAPADGQFTATEARFAQGDQFGAVTGTFVDERPQYHELAEESGECRLWLYHVAACDEGCAGTGICDAEGTCIPYPQHVQAGDVTIAGVTLEDSEYGYVPGGAVDSELFAPGDAVSLSAAGGDGSAAFALDAEGVAPIALDLVNAGGEDEDALVLEAGADLEVTWEASDGAARVRLELLTDNSGHGYPVLEMIECESADDGSITVPQSMIDAMPAKAYQNICAGSDCPPSSLMRFTEDRKTVGDHDVALRVGFQQYFILVVNDG
ncbi:MAG TPA: hypothetical protein VMZ28_23810 [Kofleriaceae bacterium]|nr:hypothetical protein [Kofleriaceae bacterium]